MKNITNLYELLAKEENTAMRNCIKLENLNADKSPEESNPGTKFHVLVQKLENLPAITQ